MCNPFAKKLCRYIHSTGTGTAGHCSATLCPLRWLWCIHRGMYELTYMHTNSDYRMSICTDVVSVQHFQYTSAASWGKPERVQMSHGWLKVYSQTVCMLTFCLRPLNFILTSSTFLQSVWAGHPRDQHEQYDTIHNYILTEQPLYGLVEARSGLPQ